MHYVSSALLSTLPMNVCEDCEQLRPLVRLDEVELCVSCFGKGTRARSDSDIEETISRFGHSHERLHHSARWLPDLPHFMQFFDWPLCCDDWCIFVGWPMTMISARRASVETQPWKRGPVQPALWRRLLGKKWAPVTFEIGAPPDESPDWFLDLNVFRCARCSRCFVVSQPT